MQLAHGLFAKAVAEGQGRHAFAETLAHAAVLNHLALARVATVTVATAALTYYFRPFAVAPLFGGVLPKFWGLYFAHNHTGALGAGQSGIWSYNGIKLTSA